MCEKNSFKKKPEKLTFTAKVRGNYGRKGKNRIGGNYFTMSSFRVTIEEGVANRIV